MKILRALGGITAIALFVSVIGVSVGLFANIVLAEEIYLHCRTDRGGEWDFRVDLQSSTVQMTNIRFGEGRRLPAHITANEIRAPRKISLACALQIGFGVAR